ncbi:MAG: response regulator [Candidatus Solibacter usitatus]|nr:response regulator [Candidatus Solibacter usitatus]
MPQKSHAETLLEHADDIVYTVRVGDKWYGGGVELINDRVRNILGYEPEEFFKDPDHWFKCVHPQDREMLAQATLRVLTSGKPETRSYRLLHKHTHEYRWIEDKCIPETDEHGRVIRIMGFARDVTDRMAGEEARQNEAILRAIFESSPDAMVASDENGRILKANQPAFRMFGYCEGELVGQSVDILLPEQFRNSHAIHREGFYSQPTARQMGSGMELFARKKDGVEFPVDIMLNATTIDGRTVVVSVVRDATARKQLEREKAELEHQFRQAQKMDAIGRLAGGVAHDFNNLLMVINGHSDLMLKRTAAVDPSLEQLNAIKKAGLRAAALTKHLLAFSRKQVQQKRVLDLNQFLGDAINMMRRLIPENVSLKTALTPGLGQVEADPSHIDQVILNLVVNACDAMPFGGELHFETRNADSDAKSLREHPDVAPGPFVELTVRDTGTGIDPEVLPHIFEPFYTTKGDGGGTGLGLATVFGVVKQAGGFIRVSSELGVGTAFHVCLPRLAQTIELEREDPSEAVSGHGGSETSLLVEDQEEVLLLVQSMLQDFGYKVLTASDPIQAARIASEHHGRIDLLLSDVVMPGMSGPELAEAILKVRPSLKILFMSGYAKDLHPLSTAAPAGSGFVQKPVSEALLGVKVRETLGPPRPAKIVVVDDEEGVRSIVARILESEGYEVLTFEDGRQAVEELERNEIDLLLTDLVMPKQEGMETILQARKRWPDLKVIAMSGAFGGRYLSVAHKLGAHETIAKPFLPDDLIRIVGDTLHRTTTRV